MSEPDEAMVEAVADLMAALRSSIARARAEARALYPSPGDRDDSEEQK